MPEHREYQFPAFAVVQAYIKGFQEKFRIQDTAPHIPDKRYELHYQLRIDSADYEWFLDTGLKLDKKPERIETPNVVVDLTEKRIEAFSDRNRHVAEVFAIVSGVQSNLFPAIGQIQPGGTKWGILKSERYPTIDIRQLETENITGESLSKFEDGQLAGVIGWQSWETYLAATLGFPTIEILPRGKGRSHLSKWFNCFYRMVEEVAGNLEYQIMQAERNIVSCYRELRAGAV